MAFKVLLVEDDNNLREIYEARLQAEGYNIVTARDGEEALGVAKTEIPDLVISDVMMPRVSGFEMLDILRNTDNLKDVKVIMLTALGQADDKTRANSLGADRYLVKSQVTLEDIVKTAHELLGDTASEAAAAPAPSTPPAAPPASPSPAVMPGPSVTPMPAPAVAPTPVVAAPAPTPAPTVVPTPPAAQTFSPTVGASQPPVVPEPPKAAPAPVAPSPALPSMPGMAPAPTPMVAPMPTPAPVAPAAPSTSEEKATIDTQIDNFVRTAPDTTPAADPNSPSTQDDAVLADAMHDLAASSEPNSEVSEAAPVAPEPASAPAAPEQATPTFGPQLPVAPTPVIPMPATSSPVTPPAAPVLGAKPEDKPQANSGSVIIANKKIIQPLSSDESKPSIHELAAREDANSMPAPGMASPATTFSPTMPTPPMPPAGPVVGGPGVAPMPAPQPPQAPPANPGGFDPNSISL